MLMLGNRFNFTLIEVAAPDKIIQGQHDRLLTCLLIKASRNRKTALLLVWVVVKQQRTLALRVLSCLIYTSELKNNTADQTLFGAPVNPYGA